MNLILISSIIIIFLGLIISFIFYINSPEQKIGIGASIEQATISEDSEVMYVKLAAGTNNEEIEKVIFILKDGVGQEYIYETLQGSKEISVPFKQSFIDWITGKKVYYGVYDYEIKAEQLGIKDLKEIKEISVSIQYRSQKMILETNNTEITPVITPRLSTKKITKTYSGGSSFGGSGSSCSPSKLCEDYYDLNQCGRGLSDGCTNSLDCVACINGTCANASCEEQCINGICQNITCTTNCTGKVCGDDGCGGTCAPGCGEGQACESGNCKTQECLKSENCFYVSVTGNGTHNGSLGDEFNLSQAMSYADSHVNTSIEFRLKEGNYGSFSRVGIGNRLSWIVSETWRADNFSNSPAFSGVYIDKDGPAYIKIEGISVNSTAGHQIGGDFSIVIMDTTQIKLLNSTIKGYLDESDQLKMTDGSIRIWGQNFPVGEILIEGIEFSYALSGGSVLGNLSGNVTFSRCEWHDWASGLTISGNNGHFVIIKNSEIYSKRYWHLIHGNTIKIAGGGYVIIEGNHIHNSGSSRGLISGAYTDQGEIPNGQSHIYIRRNLIYNSQQGHPYIWFLGATSDIEITENTVVTRKSKDYDKWYTQYDERYGDAVSITYLQGSGGSASGLVISDNIFLGRVFYSSEWTNPIINNNFFWTFFDLLTFSNNEIVCANKTFSDNKYNKDYMDTNETFWVGGDNWIYHSMKYIPNESSPFGLEIDLTDEYYPLISSSACDGSVNGQVGIAVGALPCVCTNNSQCVTVYGAGSTCNSTTRLCETTTIPPVCGDTTCNGVENCSTCPRDCGVCLVTAQCLYSNKCFYVSVNGNGTHNGSLKNEMNLDQAMNFANNKGGYTFWLSPGNFGSVVFNKGYGNETGGYNIYKANPLTTTPRSSNWYEDDIDRPSESNSVVFTMLRFWPYKDITTGNSKPQYVEVNGINVFDGYVYFQCYVSSVKVINISVFGRVPATSPYYFYTDKGDSSFYFPYQDVEHGVGSDYENIFVDSSYAENALSGIYMSGNFKNIIIKNSHVRDSIAGPVDFKNSGGYSNVILDGNHMEYQNSKADINNYVTTSVAIPDSISPRLKFTHNGNAISGTYTSTSDWIEVYDASNPGFKELRKIAYYNSTSKEVTSDTPFSFNTEVGDIVRFYDGYHGSCISFWGGSNVIIKNNKIHDCGETAGINFYGPPGKDNITITGNLLYDVHNQWTTVLDEYPPNRVLFENNTIVGYRHPSDLYGLPFRRNVGSNYSAINNLFVGTAQAGDETHYVMNNIANSGDLQEDEVGINKHNVVYNGDPANPFDGSGNFFLGGANFEQAYESGHGFNFNDAFHPMITSDACNGRINPIGIAVGALPCVCTNNSQCVQVFGTGSICNPATRKCEGVIASMAIQNGRAKIGILQAIKIILASFIDFNCVLGLLLCRINNSIL
jgi:hypothetical protein